jgi:hypothetical protein
METTLAAVEIPAEAKTDPIDRNTALLLKAAANILAELDSYGSGACDRTKGLAWLVSDGIERVLISLKVWDESKSAESVL